MGVEKRLSDEPQQGCHWSGKFKVREKSVNFRISQGNLLKVREIYEKSGKF